MTNKQQITLQEFSNPDPRVGFNIAKLSMIISRIMTALCNQSTYTKLRENYLHALEEWAANLPPNLRYFPEPNSSPDPHLSQADEVASVRTLTVFHYKSES